MLECTDTALSCGQVNGLRLTEDQINILQDIRIMGEASNTPTERLLLWPLESTAGLRATLYELW